MSDIKILLLCVVALGVLTFINLMIIGRSVVIIEFKVGEALKLLSELMRRP
jgi:hypothetical protein